MRSTSNVDKIIGEIADNLEPKAIKRIYLWNGKIFKKKEKRFKVAYDNNVPIFACSDSSKGWFGYQRNLINII